MTITKATKEPGIQLTQGIKGSYYRVQIRLKGCPHLSKNFDSFQEAKEWKRKTVAALQSGLPYETTEMRRLTVADLIDRFIQDDLKNLRNHRTIIRLKNRLKIKELYIDDIIMGLDLRNWIETISDPHIDANNDLYRTT